MKPGYGGLKLSMLQMFWELLEAEIIVVMFGHSIEKVYPLL
jgi:hypothetical protein